MKFFTALVSRFVSGYFVAVTLLLCLVTIVGQVQAQAPNLMSYQAIVRDAGDHLVTNSPVGLRVTIRQGSPAGVIVYQETHTPVTNDNGLFSTEIGAGVVVLGGMAGIDWENGPYFLETEIDPTGGTAYSITANNQLLSVPYALSSGNSYWEANGNDINNKNSGDVGIGVSNPESKLHIVNNEPGIREMILQDISSSSDVANITFRNELGVNKFQIGLYNTGHANANHGFIWMDGANPIQFGTDFTERMRIAGNGNIGFFTPTPATFIHYNNNVSVSQFHTMWDFNNTADAIARAQSLNAGNGNRGWFGITNYSGTALAANGLMGLALNATGTASGVEGFSNSTAGTGVLAGFVGGSSLGATGWALFANGWAGGTTAWQNVSDQRLKKNIVTIDGALDKVMQLRGVEYNFDSSNFPELGLDTEKKQVGFIAQEVEKVFPHIVREANVYSAPGEMDNGMSREHNVHKVKSLSYTLLVPVLVEALKEQQAQIEALRAELEALKTHRQSDKDTPVIKH